MTQGQLVAGRLIIATLETIEESPDGAPLGPMYMAYQMHGISLETFNSVIEMLERKGLIKVSNHVARRIKS